jgi:serine/threonine protein kinase
MPQIPQSQYYRFETRISQNDIAESWIAENSETGSKCFLKIEAQNPSLGQAAIRSTLTKSFECQADLKDPQVNTAISKRIEKGRLIIEYPFIDPDNWKTLTPGLFWEGFADILPQVCLIVDYLHLMGMVHCDLKLENFMVRFTNGGHKVILADLDFLRPDFSPLKGEIIGTPEYIAPEVMTNEVYTSQSDIYSLGMSFKNYSEQINDSNKFSANEIENFNNIITAMIDPDSVNRPSILLDVINNAGLIDKTRFDDLNRQLFKMQLASSWESALAEQALGLNQLQRFLLEKNLVFGIHDDLLDDFVSAYKINPTESLTLIAAFSNEIEILRFEDCWHIKISDQELLDYFGQIDRIKDKKDSLFQIDESIPEKQLRQFLDKADEEYNQSRYLRTYLILKFLTTNGLPKGNTDLKQNILEALIRNAVALNRSSETVEYLSHLMDRIPHDSDRYLELLFKLAFQYIKSGNLDAAHEKISQGIRDSEKLSDKIHKLDFQRLESWVLSARGEQDRALEILETIMQKANALKNDHLIIGTHNYLGSLYRRKGDFKKALESYQRSLKQAQNSELMNEAISSLTNLAMLSFEYAEYKQSIKYARLGLKSILGPEDIYTAPYLHTMLALSYARISEYDKAEYWNQRYLSHGLANYSNNTFGKFYLDHGWIKMARGQILHGRNYLTRAVHILELSSASSNLGKAYTSLGEIALFQGDSENCRKYLGKAREIFEKIGDSAALSDIKLIDNLNSHFNENDDDRQKLYQSMLELAACNSRYLAALALYYILIGEDRTIISRALDDIPDKIPYLKNEEAPLFRADILLSKMQKAGGDDFSQKAVILKSVYRTLHDSGQLYAALMACLRIARLYKDDSNFKLAGKFLKQAQNIAFRLKNRKQIKLIESELNSLPQGDAKKADSVELLHYVSDIIKDLKNYESTLEKLIQFAVDETGAERGVLLLRSDPQSELRSRAYINCDNESLKDIQDFSKSIPFHVSREQRPFIIDNAMTDSRTRGFKSIAIHNILSVICMPIFRNENVIGVIYLDHHTIPALFEEEDITLITSMANMISVVLSAAMEYRTVKTSRDQMITDMTKLGGSQNFVTQNQEMLEILKRNHLRNAA